METVLLSLGSNIGPRRRRINDAVKRISSSILENVVTSSLYETEPVGYTQQPSFINLVLMGQTSLSAIDVHEACKGLEIAQGRVHREKWREREIDIDLLLYGDEIVETEPLTVPHERMAERRFVLVPAVEIAANIACPRTGCSMQELLMICEDTSKVKEAGKLRR